MKRNMKSWMFGLLNSTQRQSLPILTYPGANLIGKSIREIAKDARAQSDCIVAVAKRFPMIAALGCMDLSVEAEAFGCAVRFEHNEIPTITHGVVRSVDEIDDLAVPSLLEGRAMTYFEAIRQTVASVPDLPVFAGMIGPFSLAGRLFDMTEAMVSVLTDPDEMHVLVEKSTQYLISYANAFKQVGANGIVIAEPAAGLLSPQHCNEFSSLYVKKIVDAVQDDHFMLILHNCGNATNLVSSMVSTGCMGFHFGNAVDMAQIMPQVPWGRIAFGNVDPARVMRNGTADTVANNTRELLYQTAAYKNFVLSTGCDLPHETPFENIDAFFAAQDRFNEEIFLGITA